MGRWRHHSAPLHPRLRGHRRPPDRPAADKRPRPGTRPWPGSSRSSRRTRRRHTACRRSRACRWRCSARPDRWCCRDTSRSSRRTRRRHTACRRRWAHTAGCSALPRTRPWPGRSRSSRRTRRRRTPYPHSWKRRAPRTPTGRSRSAPQPRHRHSHRSPGPRAIRRSSTRRSGRPRHRSDWRSPNSSLRASRRWRHTNSCQRSVRRLRSRCRRLARSPWGRRRSAHRAPVLRQYQSGLLSQDLRSRTQLSIWSSPRRRRLKSDQPNLIKPRGATRTRGEDRRRGAEPLRCQRTTLAGWTMIMALARYRASPRPYQDLSDHL